MNTETKIVKLGLDEIRMDTEIQPREENNEAVIREYAEAMRGGAKFPPVVVFNDGDNHWLADGFHRVLAAKEAGLKKIDAEVREGTSRDAILYAVGANATHGLRRTNADKRKVVETLLKDEEWRGWSDREIAKKCLVSHEFVRKMRADICQQTTDNEAGSLSTVDSGFGNPDSRKCADGRTIDTSNIGKGGMSEPQEKQPGEPQNKERDGENRATGQFDDTPEPGSDNAPTPAPARKPHADITCVVAEFGPRLVKGDNGEISPSGVHNALSMTVPEAVEFLKNGIVPERPNVVMNTSDFLKVLISFAEQEKPQEELKVVITSKKAAAVA